MKLKDSITQYFEDLPNRWSANFLALLGGVNFVFVLFGAFVTVLYDTILSSDKTTFVQFIKDFLSGILIYSISLCFISFTPYGVTVVPIGSPFAAFTIPFSSFKEKINNGTLCSIHITVAVMSRIFNLRSRTSS